MLCQDSMESRAIMHADATEDGGEEEVRAKSSKFRVALGLGALLTIAAAASLVFMHARPQVAFLAGKPAQSPMVGLIEASRTADFSQAGTDPCDGLPFLRLREVTHSNLGNKGPDAGEEGLVFEGEEMPSETKVKLVIHATSPYVPQAASMNGFSGRYVSINLKGGTSVDLSFHLLDEHGEPLTLTEADFTFFDLDSGKDGSTTEFIKVKPYNSAIYQSQTELDEDHLDKGYSEFKATTFGSGTDNPDDPSKLTMEQKDRAITLTFLNFHKMEATFGSTEGTSPRWFLFVARPSLLCAKRKGADVPGDVVMVHNEYGTHGHEATTVAATTTTPEATTTAPPTTTTIIAAEDDDADDDVPKAAEQNPAPSPAPSPAPADQDACCMAFGKICGGISWPWCR
jgi:hypothetical protein